MVDKLIKPKLINTLMLILVGGFFVLAPLKHNVIGSTAVCDQLKKSFDSCEDLMIYLQQATRDHPLRKDLRECKALIAYEADDWDTAIDDYQLARTLGDISLQSQINLGFAYFEAGQPDEALEVWYQVIEEDPEQFLLYEKMVPIIKDSGDFQALEDLLNDWIEIERLNPQPYYQSGLLLSLSDAGSAIPLLSRAAQIDDKYEESANIVLDAINLTATGESEDIRLRVIGQALGNIGEWRLAQEAFEESVRIDVKSAEAWALLGEAQQQNDTGDGYDALSRAVELDPDSILVRSLMALYLKRTGQFDAAISYIRDLANDEPDVYIWQLEWGAVHMEAGDPYAALQHFQRAAELEPTAVETWTAIARCSLNANIEIVDIGIPAAREALALNEDDPALNDLMGVLFMFTEDMDSAERFLKKTVSLDPNYMPAYLHLGQYYILSGDQVLAIKNLNKVVASEYSDEKTKDVAQRILNR